MKRVAVSGKGGSGKTTIASTFARLSGRRMGHLLAIDGDPNPNLARSMGVQRESWPLLPADLMTYVEKDGKRVSQLSLPIAEIVSQFAAHGPDNVRLIALGEVDHASQGCLCGKHAIVREVVGAALSDANEPVVLDMEASLEHMRRGTVRHVDVLLVVTEPYYRSLEAAGRIVRLAREMQIPEIVAVANKVRNDEEEDAIRTYLEGLDVPLVAIIPHDEHVTRSDLDDRSLLDAFPDAPAVAAIDALARGIYA